MLLGLKELLDEVRIIERDEALVKPVEYDNPGSLIGLPDSLCFIVLIAILAICFFC